MSDQLLVYVRHARMIRRPSGRRLCLEGIQAWCERYGIDFDTFRDQGVPEAVILATGDPFGAKAVANAREEAGRGR